MPSRSHAASLSLDTLALQIGDRVVVREPVFTFVESVGGRPCRHVRTDAVTERFGTVVNADASRIQVNWDGSVMRWLQRRTEGKTWHRAVDNVRPEPSPTEIWASLSELDRGDLVHFANYVPHRKMWGRPGNHAACTRRLVSQRLIARACTSKCWILTELGERVIEVQVTLGRVLRQSAAPYCVLVSNPRPPVATEKP